VGFVFFSTPESDTIEVNLQMSPGTSRETTGTALAKIDDALYETVASFVDDPNELLVMSSARIGITIDRDASARRLTGDNVGSMHAELVSSDQRPVRIDQLIEAWDQRIPAIANLESLSLKERVGGPPGRELDIRLSGGSSSNDLKQASLELQALLKRLPGVSQIEDDLPYGKEEV